MTVAARQTPRPGGRYGHAGFGHVGPGHIGHEILLFKKALVALPIGAWDVPATRQNPLSAG